MTLSPLEDIVDLDAFPLDREIDPAWDELVSRCAAALARDGLVNLPGFLRAPACTAAVAEVAPLFADAAFTHARRHNIYFEDPVDGLVNGLADSHPTLREFTTVNHTLCADQIPGSVVVRLYEWPAFQRFIAAVTGMPALYPMDDPLARVNVMAYRDGEALNWHFDRAAFTTTLLLQQPEAGGVFEYAKDLRSADDPNHDGVARLLDGRLAPVQLPLSPGTLTIFRGINTAHRVTQVEGPRDRIIAVFSYFDRPGVSFSESERLGFYGRTG